MPGEKAVPEFKVEHQGRTVYLCCAGCVQKFKANPGPYLANLPPADGMPPAKIELERPRWLRWWDQLALGLAFCERHLSILLAVIGACLAVGVASRISRRDPQRSRSLKLLTHRSAYLVLLLTGVCVVLWREMELAREEAKSLQAAIAQQQVATENTQLAQAGKLLQWAWPQGLHELPKGVRNTYYRGNDERSDKLFNGGNYRTATYHLSVIGNDGKELESGMRVAGQQLRVRLEIVRAPNTAGNFFKADLMAKVFMSSIAESSKNDAYPLTTTEAERCWTVTAPIGEATATGYQRLAGVWAVSVGNPKTEPSKATIYHSIQAVLHIQDGMLLPESTLWMIPVYPSPILQGPQADGQWFSDRPIPEIPDGKNATDPKLLGQPEAKGK